MNQQDIDTLQIAIGSSERFNEDASTPVTTDPFRNRDLLESLLDDSNDDPSPNTTNWQSPPDRAVVEFYICRPGTKPPQSCLDSEAITSKTFRNVRDVVHSNEFYISALQEAHKEIADLYPFWQLRQANLNYELTILGVGYVKEGATDPLQSYHVMDFPITPAAIQKAPRPQHTHEYSHFSPKLELAVYLDFTVDNPTQPRTYQLELNSKMELVPLTIKPKAGSIFVETTSSQSHESRLPGPSTHKALMAPPLPRLPPVIKTEKPDDDDEITILSSTVESESERRKRKKEKSRLKREKMLSYVLNHLEQRQSDLNPPQAASRIKPPPVLHDRPSTIIPTRKYRSPEPDTWASIRSLTPPHSSRASSSHSEHRSPLQPRPPLHSRSWLEQEVAKLKQQQLRARNSLRGRGSRPRGRQSQHLKRPQVFYQDYQPSPRDTPRARGISKRSRPYRGKKRLTELELAQYREQNAAIVSAHSQRRHTGAVPSIDKFSYIPLQPSDSPIHNPHSNNDSQMDVDPATPPRPPRDDRARPETDENPKQRRPITERLGLPLRPNFPPSSSSSSSTSDSDSLPARHTHKK